ncbi:MAG: GTP-binding protein [Candidatus Kariarchaeaceae archaeon]
MSAQNRRIFKICLLGEGAVGKTALRQRYLGEGFKQSYAMTIGADFAVKRVTIDNQEFISQIWDLAGQVRFSSVREVYYRGAAGALLVFDISRPDTFEKIPNWIKELLDNNKGRIVPMVLIGNKSDLRETTPNHVTRERGMTYAEQLSKWSEFEIPYIETSAKTGDMVEDAFSVLLRNINDYLERES